MPSTLRSRSLIEQAKGVLAVRLGIEPGLAAVPLQAYADRRGLDLAAAAADLLAPVVGGIPRPTPEGGHVRDVGARRCAPRQGEPA